MPSKPTARTTIDVPSELAPLLRAILEHAEDFKTEARAGRPNFAKAEEDLGSLVARAEAAMLGDMLASMDPATERVTVEGDTYRRLEQPARAQYTGLRGEMLVQRGLYRKEGLRNGPTIVPMELVAGIVEGRYTPGAARLAAALAQEMPSRSADVVCRSAGVLPHSRAAQQRVGLELGKRWEALGPDAERALVREMEIPPEVVAASVAVDRISLPMAEPRVPTAEDRARGVKSPIDVNYRMSFVAALTLYDAEGDPLTTIRYAHVAEGGAAAMEASLRGDLETLHQRRPDVKLLTLGDGAAEMQGILDRATASLPVAARVVDVWHLVEHLGHGIGATGRFVEDLLADWKDALLSRDGAIEEIETQLREWEREYAKEACPPGLHAALTYIVNHRERLRYATLRTARLPIGSGTVEATGKAIVTVRMKRPGARWVPVGAQAIMSLRALATSGSGRWDAAILRVLDAYRVPVRPTNQRRVRTHKR